MKIINILQILIISIGILKNIAHARSAADVERDFFKAIDTAVSTYEKEGMVGLVTKTKECYSKNTTNLIYCTYFDVASRSIDQIFVDLMKFPPNYYYIDSLHYLRVGIAFGRSGMDINAATKSLELVAPAVKSIIEKKLIDKK